MHRLFSILTALIVGLTLPPRLTRGENRANLATSGGWGSDSRYGKLYKEGSRTEVQGNVLSMEDLIPYEGMDPGVQLKVRGADGDLFVHLGPRWFVLDRDLQFTRGEPITVVGVKIRFQGKPAVVASEVRQGTRRVELREPASGTPRWGEVGGKRVNP